MPLDHPRGIAEERQRTPGGNLRVELPQGAGSGVARVGKRGLAALFPFPVQRPERFQRQVDFTAHFEQLRRVVTLQPQGDIPDSSQVGGNILTNLPIATGGTLDK